MHYNVNRGVWGFPSLKKTNRSGPVWALGFLFVADLFFPSAHADMYADMHSNLDAPFVLQNENPLVSVRGMPRNLGADLVPRGFSTQVSYSVASHFEIEDSGAEQVVLDGETERLSLRWQWGLSPGWEVGLDVPLVRHSGGYLDSLIIDWHDWFNLPQNGRDIAPQDELQLAYAGGGEAILLNDDASGVGDVRLLGARQLSQSAGRATALRAYVKLPTGDEDELLGSGGVDAGITLHHRRALYDNLTLNLWGGAAYLSGGDVLSNRNRGWVVAGGAAAALRLNRAVSLKVQWDAHSQVYEDTRLQQLNEVAYVLSFGGSIRLGPRQALDIVVVENYPHPEITPDVAFQLGWRWFPGPGS